MSSAQHTCRHCGEHFKPTHEFQAFCSDYCMVHGTLGASGKKTNPRLPDDNAVQAEKTTRARPHSCPHCYSRLGAGQTECHRCSKGKG